MKKNLSLFLVFVLILALLPATATNTMADLEGDWYYRVTDGEAEITRYIGTDNDVTVPAAIDGYPVTSVTGAFAKNETVTNVTLSKGITVIGPSTFTTCPLLQRVVLPDGLVQIGSHAFLNCTALTEISIPDTVTEIGESAFSGCAALQSIMIPKGMTQINPHSFQNCSALVSVTIPYGLTSIGQAAFSGCSALQSVVIPESVRSIGVSAFYNCASLTDVTLPSSEIDIAANAFALTPYGGGGVLKTTPSPAPAPSPVPTDPTPSGALPTADVDVNPSGKCGENLLYTLSSDGVLTISGTGPMYDYYESWYMMDGISPFAFSKQIKSIVIEDGVTRIGNNAFDAVYNLQFISIGKGVTSIGERFLYGSSMDSVTIPENVQQIGANFGAGFSAIHVAEGNQWFSEIGGALFNKDKTTLLRYPGAKIDTSYTVPDGVKVIGDDAFSRSKNLKEIIISEGVTVIGNGVFSYCYNLETVSISSTVQEIAADAFLFSYLDDAKLSRINVAEGNKCFSSGDGVLFNKDHTELLCYPVGRTETSYTIPNGVKRIGERAFYSCTNLLTVSLPSGIEGIGDSAFWSCSKLTDLVFPDTLLSIGESAFMGCYALKSISIPDSVTEIKADAFASCSGVKSVVIGNGVTELGSETNTLLGYVGPFSSCSELTSVTFGKNIKRIGKYSFDYCDKLTDVYYQGSETEWYRIKFEERNEPLLNATIHYADSGRTTITVTVNGTPVVWTDAEPFVNGDNRTMVPLRPVAEALGLTVEWEDTGFSKYASFTDGIKTIRFTIGANSAGGHLNTDHPALNWLLIPMDTTAIIVNSRTYAPIRYLAEYFGHTVDWDGATKTVIIH